MKLRPPLSGERQLLAFWGAAAGGALLFAPFLPRLARLVPGCPFRELTGLPCLSCGTTRAALSLLGGDLAAALRFNPLASVAGIAFLSGVVLAPLWLLLRLPVLDGLPEPTPLRRAAGIAFLVAAWGWQVIRGV
jgi:hypothetical protein